MKKQKKIELINFFKSLTSQIDTSEKKLDEIDQKGVFSSDDEIGWFFNEIKKIQNDISRFKTNL